MVGKESRDVVVNQVEQQHVNPTADEFRAVIAHFVSGVTVVTTARDGERFGATANAVTSLSVDPPMIVVCLNESSTTRQAIAQSAHLAVNILGEDQGSVAVRFAGRSDDKFDGVAVSKGSFGQPLIDGALASVECRVERAISAGTHVVLLAEVLSAHSRGGDPLAYFRSSFGRFAAASA